MSFKVGDVCVIVGLDTRCAKFNGTECTIVGELDMRYGSISQESRMSYEVRTALDGAVWLVEEPYLRLKRPPSDEDSRPASTPCKWSDCVWRPERVKA